MHRLPIPCASATLLCISLILLSVPAEGQGYTQLPGGLDSGYLHQPGPGVVRVWQNVVQVPGATALRLVLQGSFLSGDADRILVWDRPGNVQALTREGLQNWGGHSAFFNGNRVTIALELGPGSRGRLVVPNVLARFWAPQPESLCGPDNRVASADDRVCRLVDSVPSTAPPCTGFLIKASSTILSAGHCNSPPPSAFGVAEFRVPSSNAAGMINHSLVADQFPIDFSTLWLSSPISIGHDYAVMRLHPNSSGQTAASRFGFFTLATTVPGTTGYTVRVTGFGSDTTPSTANNTQQTAIGPVIAASGTELRYQVDTTSGNSGSPIILESTGEILGIHTNGGCNAAPTSYNSGTMITNFLLQAGITSVSGCTTVALAESTTTLLCTPTVFSVAPPAGSLTRWNTVAVSSAFDWDLTLAGITSAASFDECDFFVSNGHFVGGSAPSSGVMQFGLLGIPMSTVGTPATGEHDSASVLPLGTAKCETFAAGQVIDLYEFDVTPAGVYELRVGGDPALSWRLFAPGGSAAWRPRSDAIASGAVGSAGTTVTLGPGFHALAIFRNGGPSPSSSTVTMYLGDASTFNLDAITSGGGTGDLCLDVAAVPAVATNVILLVSDTPAGGAGPLLGLFPSPFLNTILLLPPTPFSLLHFPTGANPYATGPIAIPAPTLAALAGLTWEARAVAYSPLAPGVIVALSPIRTMAW